MSHKDMSYKIRLGERGRLVLPAAIRKRLGLRAGEYLNLTVGSDGDLQLSSLRQVVRESRGKYGTRAPHRSLVDELIAERRSEARRESAPD